MKKFSTDKILLTEARYDYVVRTLIKDIISLYKFQREGEFSLPSDLYGDEKMTYNFPGIDDDFSLELNFVTDENVEDFELDADYYRDADEIEITIVSNPHPKNLHLQNLIGELNETIRHELEHVYQKQSGLKFPKEPKSPIKYYLQPHELEAQFMGFSRRARKENRDIEDVVRSWFRRNKNKHRLNPKQEETVISKILSFKDGFK